MDLNDILSLTNEAEIGKLLTQEVYETLTASDSEIVKNAIQRAGIQIFAILKGWGIETLEEKDREVVKLALEKLTLYEISAYADVELSYEAEKKQAMEILKSYFGGEKPKAYVIKDKEARLKIWDTT